MADLTPQQALEQFEKTTGLTILVVTESDTTPWFRDGDRPMFESGSGDRRMHIDELSAPQPSAPEPVTPGHPANCSCGECGYRRSAVDRG